MYRIELSLSLDFVPDWGVTEAFRELLQNAIDSEVNDQHEMEYNYTEDKQSIFIRNQGACLERKTLCMGGGNKQDCENTIGRNAEGYKLAIVSLLRANKRVKVFNGPKNEVWIPCIAHSPKFNCDVVVIEVHENSDYNTEYLTFVIEDVTSEEWNECRKMDLSYYQDVTKHKTNNGYVLKGDSVTGKLFVGFEKSIFITNSPSLKYGYVFHPNVVKLDRERRMIDSFDLQRATFKQWENLALDDDGYNTFKHMIENGDKDIEYAKYEWMPNKQLSKRMVDDFRKEHGVDRFPVSSNENAKKIDSIHKEPVIVSKEYENLLTREMGSVDDFVNSATRANKWDYVENLGGKMVANEILASYLLGPIGLEYNIYAVKFSNDCKCHFDGDDCLVDVSCFNKTIDIISVILAEYGVKYGMIEERKKWAALLSKYV